MRLTTVATGLRRFLRFLRFLQLREQGRWRAEAGEGPEEIRIRVAEQQGGKLLEVSGVVNFRTSPVLRKVLRRWGRRRVPGVMVSLKDVEFMDSSGVATLIESLEQMKSYGGRLLLTDVGPQVRKILAISGLSRLEHAAQMLHTPETLRKRAS